MPGWHLEHTYATLPPLFFTAATPTPVREPRLVVLNRTLAANLELDAAGLDTPDGAAILAGNAMPPGAQPIAQAYAGHQFGHFTGLGDGRAILLGEQVTSSGGRFDIQLKGAGPTRYSRRGDGRAALGPMLREFIISEAMHALRIPTTRSLAVATTGEPVYRETVLDGAVLTRVASSHIRVGTMEWAAAHKDTEAMRALVEYTRARHYPAVPAGPDAPLALFRAIVERQARLIAQWQLVGFIHGVMNTDNMALSGETIDYGPCAFMDAYDPRTVFSSIDSGGRYSYGNQPGIAQWNLARLAEAMLPVLHEDQQQAVDAANRGIEAFAHAFEAHWLAGMRAKLGLRTEEPEDRLLADDLLQWMQDTAGDFTNTFRTLSNQAEASRMAGADPVFAAWHRRLLARQAHEPGAERESERLMQVHNPAVIPRNHKVEEALAAATSDRNLAPLEALLTELAVPYDHLREREAFTTPAASAQPYRTFCGT